MASEAGACGWLFELPWVLNELIASERLWPVPLSHQPFVVEVLAASATITSPDGPADPALAADTPELAASSGVCSAAEGGVAEVAVEAASEAAAKFNEGSEAVPELAGVAGVEDDDVF